MRDKKRFLEDAANEINIKIDKNAAELIIDSVGNDSFTRNLGL